MTSSLVGRWGAHAKVSRFEDDVRGLLEKSFINSRLSLRKLARSSYRACQILAV